MKIGIIGTRGIPNRYGGFEQFAEFIAPMLVQKGHEVTVYNSSLHPQQISEWKGVRIITKKDSENRIGTAAQFLYDLRCILNCRKQNYDIILQLGYTSSSIWSFLYPAKSKIITNMDGLEWKRSKYSPAVKRFLKLAEKWAVKQSDVLIADSIGIQQYISNTYKKDSVFIAYGAELFKAVESKPVLDSGLQPFEYNLLIARMEPENNIETIIEGNINSNTSQPLLIVGNTSNKFGEYLKKKYNSSSLIFFEAVYDLNFLNHLRFYSNIYFHGHSVGGTNPSLLEAMASGSLIAAHENIFNRSVLGDDAFYFKTAKDIADLLNSKPEKKSFSMFIQNNSVKIAEDYSWQKIAQLLETCFINALH